MSDARTIKTALLVMDNLGNADLGQNPERRLPGTCSQEIVITERTLGSIAKFVAEYISEFELGAGNFMAEIILDGKAIARVSYNGRVWGLDGEEVRGGELNELLMSVQSVIKN